MHRLFLFSALVAGCTRDEPPPPIDLTEVLGPDEARAGVLTEAHVGAFIGGAAAESRPGDILLYNDRARFVVRGLRQGHFYAGTPGGLIDLDVVRPEGQADRDGVDELVTMVGLGRLFSARASRVVSSGGDGEAAEVRLVGTDESFAFLEGAVEAPGLFEARGLDVVQTLRLEPGVPVLEVRTTVRNTTDEALRIDIADVGMVDLATVGTFVPGAGFEGDAMSGGRSMMAMVSHRNDLALAMFLPEGAFAESALSDIAEDRDMWIASAPPLELEPGEEASSTRLVGVARDLASLEAHRRLIQGLPAAAVEGTVSADAPVAGARVFLTDADGAPQTVAITDELGRYRLTWDPGDWSVVVSGDANNEQMDFPEAIGAYGLYAHASANEVALAAFEGEAVATPLADGYGRSEPAPVTLVDGQVVVQDAELVEPAILRVRVEDEAGDLLPSMVHVVLAAGEVDPFPRDRRLGEGRPSGGARKALWLLDGELETRIVPGTYDLVAHHGFLYELDRAASVVLESGRVEEVTLALGRAHDTPGHVSADLHTHATPSLDGRCTVEERLATAAVGGLQIHVATDHDHVADYRPAATRMGLDPLLITLPGDEISPVVRGHFNIYPVEPDPELPNGGAPRWWEHQVDTSDLLALFRDRAGDDAVLQVNHGRDNGMFEYSYFDPITSQPGKPGFFGDDFDTMEILNGKRYSDTAQLRQDWCAMHALGLRPTAVGVSDSHTRIPGAGYARTYVDVGTDRVGEVDVDEFVAALKAGRAIVSGGPFVVFEADDGSSEPYRIGDTVTSGAATLHIQVLGPSWMGIGEVRLFTTGCELVETWTVDGPVAAPLWFEAAVDVEPGEDAYYFVEVEGWTDLWPVWPGGRAYAMTNPIYVEAP